jgi:hypothetical protein
MAGIIINPTPAITILEAQRRGKMAMSLTNFDSDAQPKLLGTVEVSGALYEFSSLESISGWSGISNNTDCFIKLVPTPIDPGDDIVLAEYTTTPPTWDPDKGGWYGTYAAANNRYIGGLHRGASSSDYESKWLYLPLTRNIPDIRVYGDGRVQFNAICVAGSLSGTKSQDNIYDTLSPLVPNPGDQILANGAFHDGSKLHIVSGVGYYSANGITVYYIDEDGSDGGLIALSGGGESYDCSIRW